MSNILSSIIQPSNQSFIAFMVVASTIRVFLELTPFTPESWPLSKELAKRVGEKNVLEFHRIGLYICLGQIILWAPELLFSKSY